MELIWIVQGLLGVCGAVGAFLYKDLKAKVERAQQDLLQYKIQIAESYVSHLQLTQAIDNLNRNIESVASGVTRIEARMYESRNN